ncbi:MAG: nitroreductase family protein [Clostridia bacterium]|nr:nitroreductase family protein [Clostridia bacterium]
MDIYELIKNRVSIRAYKTDSVPLETVKRIVQAAGMAPSWGNKQCWRFVIVDSHVVKNIMGQASGQPNIAKACEEAPYVIALCANAKESGVKNGMEYYLFDSALAMQNLVLAAQAEGLSTCIIGWFDEKAVRGVLNVPDGFKVVAYTPLGYSNEEVLPRKRKKLEETVFRNHWGKTCE